MGVTTYGLPGSVIANPSQDIVQLLALINSAGDELAREYQWQALSTQYLFSAQTYSYTGTTTDGSATLTGMSSIIGLDETYMCVGTYVPQDTFINTAPSGSSIVLNQTCTGTGSTTFTFSKVLFAFPSDFDRLTDRTQWDKSKHWEMLGPSSPQQREWLRSGYISTGPRIRFWTQGDYFQIWPPLGSNESLAYEYSSKWWIKATGDQVTSKSAFSVDTDTCIFPDALMRLLIKLKYFEVKGFDTTALYRDYMVQRDLAKAHDSASPTLSMAPQPANVLIGFENIPDSNYGT